ncbi:MAG: hypothetical protein ACTXOO_02080 [Sodalis sp. (in: enterobacteria)]
MLLTRNGPCPRNVPHIMLNISLQSQFHAVEGRLTPAHPAAFVIGRYT